MKSKGTQLFNVPNDSEGQTFMDSMSKYLHRPIYKTVKRGRGSRKEHGNQSNIPIAHSEWIAVYVEGQNMDSIRRTVYMANKDSEEVAQLKRMVEALERENHAATIVNTRLKNEVEALEAERNQTEAYADSIEDKLNDTRSQLSHATATADTAIKHIKVGTGMLAKVRVEGDTIIVG